MPRGSTSSCGSKCSEGGEEGGDGADHTSWGGESTEPTERRKGDGSTTENEENIVIRRSPSKIKPLKRIGEPD